MNRKETTRKEKSNTNNGNHDGKTPSNYAFIYRPSYFLRIAFSNCSTLDSCTHHYLLHMLLRILFRPATARTRKMHISAIPLSWGDSNNYAYLLIDEPSRHAWLIDPAFPEDVQKYLASAQESFELKAIVNTHHHWDHAGGNGFFHKKYPDLPIIAGTGSELVTYTPLHEEVIDLGDNISVTALHTPCHTQDSICYYAHDANTGEKAVFTGDTLFTSGCGRFFEGWPEQMNAALNKVLAALPHETVVYSGHEYTRSNVRFSKKVLQNSALDRLEKFASENEFTTGKFTIGDELEFNPFMRLLDPQVLKATGKSDPVEVMAKLREMKNKG